MRKHKGYSFVILLVLSLCVFIGWHMLKYRLNLRALDKYMVTEKQFPEYNEVRRGFRDTLQSWIDRKVENIQFCKNWPKQIDELLLFDEDRRRCTFVIHMVNTDSGGVLDLTNYVFAKKYNNSWYYYYGGMLESPSYKNPGESVERALFGMSQSWHIRLCAEEEFNIWSCTPGNRIIDVWDEDWRKDAHEAFLRSRKEQDSVIEELTNRIYGRNKK